MSDLVGQSEDLRSLGVLAVDEYERAKGIC